MRVTTALLLAIVAALSPRTFALTVTNLSPLPDSTITSPPTSIIVTFSGDVNPATVLNASIQLVGAGVDGLFGTTDDVTLSPTALNVSSNQLTIDLTGVTMPNGKYRIVIRGNGAPTSGLVAYWPLEEGSGTSTADSTGNGNTGTLINGPTWAAGKIGNAVSFDGSNDQVKVNQSASIEPSNGVTVSFWGKITSTLGGGVGDLLRKEAPFAGGYVFRWNNGDGKLGFHIDGNTAGQYWYCNDPSPNSSYLNAWHHYLGTYDGASKKLSVYVDGVLKQTVTAGLTTLEHTDDLYLMYVNYGSQVAVPGTLDEIRIYDHALSTSEIQSLAINSTAVTDNSGNALDGEPNANLPSGNGTAGGDFTADFTLNMPPPQITSITPVSNPENTTVNLTLNGISFPTWSGTPSYRPTVSFDGIDDAYVVPSSNLINSSTFTIEAWVKKGFQCIKRNGSPWVWEQFILSAGNGGVANFWIAQNSIRYPLSSTTPIGNDWTHLAATYDGSTQRIYINGVLDAQNTVNLTVQPWTENMVLYAEPFWDNTHCNGSMSEFRFWKVARSQAEIAANMNVALSAGHPDLVVRYDFSNGGPDLVDTTGNGHTGTPQGSPTFGLSDSSPVNVRIWNKENSRYATGTLTSASTTVDCAIDLSGLPGGAYNVDLLQNGLVIASLPEGFTVVAAPFQVTDLSFAPGITLNSRPSSIVATFSKNTDQATVSTQSVKLVRAGTDGTFGSADDVTIFPIGLTSANNTLTLDLSSTQLPDDKYRLSVSGSGEIYFDGNNDLVTIADHADFQLTNLTLEAWIRVDSLPSFYGQIVFRGDDNSANDPWYLAVRPDGKIDFQVGVSGGQSFVARSALPVTIGAWTHVSGVFESGTKQLRLYVNAQQSATATANADPIQALTGPNPGVGIGNLESIQSSSQSINGSIRNVSVWNVVRSQAQIQNDMENGLSGNEAGLVAFWPINEGYGQTINDKTSNAHHGTRGSSAIQSSDDPTWSKSAVLDENGNVFDGEPNASLPSGNGIAGGDFTAEFTLFTPPFQLTALTPAPGSALTAAPTSVVATFSKSIDPVSVNGSSVKLVSSGVDGDFNTLDDVVVAPASLAVDGAALTIDLTGVSVPDGEYQIQLRSLNMPAGSIAYWPLNEGSGTTTADSSGYGNAGTLVNGPTWISGKRGNALNFDGSNDYVALGSSGVLNFSANQAFAVTAWFKTTDVTGPIVSFRNDVDEDSVINITIGYNGVDTQAGRLRGLIRQDANGPVAAVNGAIVNDGNWHHVVLQRNNGNVVSLYLDGVLQMTSATAGSGGSLTTNLRTIGAERFWIQSQPTASENYLQGQVDEVRVFDHQLSDSEILALQSTVGISDSNGNAFDGEPNAGFPSGNGAPGGDFTAEFTLTTPPLQITALTPAPGSSLTTVPSTVVVTFSENVEPNSISPGTVQLIHAGKDGIIGNTDDVLISPTSLTVNGAQVTLDLTGTKVPDGAYRIKFLSNPGTPPSSGLNAYIAFDEGTGATAADSSGNGINGTVTNATWTNGKFGKALYYNGINSYVTTSSPDIPTPWTFGVWVKREDSTNIDAYLMASMGGNLKLEQYPNLKKVGVSAFGVADHPFNYEAPIGQWVHLTFVGTSTTTTLYVNGNLQDTAPYGINLPMANIGASHFQDYPVKGTLDELRVYNRALSPAEIYALAGGGITNLYGNRLDGEPNAGFPSGNGAAGGDFTADFSLTTPPLQVTALTPAPDSALTTPPTSITVTFSKDVDPASVNMDSVTLVEAGVDGNFDTSDDIKVNPSGYSVNANVLTLDLSGVKTPDGKYRVKLSGNEVERKALNFDGNGTFVKAPQWLTGTGTQVTLECWARPTSYLRRKNMMVLHRAFFNDTSFEWDNITQPYFYANIRGGNPIDNEVSTVTPGLTTNSWYHVAVTWDGALIRIYLNGQLEDSTPRTQAVNWDSSYFGSYIGGDGYDGWGGFFEGALRDIRIWNVARTGAQIQANMNSLPAGPHSGLLAHYEFNEGSGQIANDSSGANKHASLGSTTAIAANDPQWITVLATGLSDLNGNILDGEVNANLPSGNGTAGGDFTATFTLTTPPLQVTAMLPQPNSVVTGSPAAIAVTFSKNVDPTTVTSSSFIVIGRGPDGVFDSGDDIIVVPSSVTVNANTAALSLVGVPLSPDTYRARLLGSSGSGHALSFDGVDDRALIDSFGAVAPTDEATIEFWQNVDSSKFQSTFSMQPDVSGNRMQAYVPKEDDRIYFDFGDDNSAGRLGYQPPSNIVNSWHHFALVSSKSGDYIRIYRNGVLEASKSGASQYSPSPANPLSLGFNHVGSDMFFGGMIDDLRIWNVARTQSQIQSNWQRRLAGDEPNLIGYWDFEEPSGQIIFDKSVSQRNGVLGTNTNVEASDPSRVAVSLPIYGAIADLNGNVLDGEFAGAFPSGNNTAGGDFVASFRVNAAPVTFDQALSTHAGTPIAITLVANDSDNDTLSYTVGNPTIGAVIGTAPNLMYIPPLGITGTASFQFSVNDGFATSNSATVIIDLLNLPPSVTVTAAPLAVPPGEFVTFLSNGTDPDGDVLTYSWSFGDNSSSAEQNTVHAYSQTGTYTATVTVTDPSGATASASVVIVVDKAPTVRITTDEIVGFGGLPMLFDASYSTDPENQIVSYTWDFGDGTPPGSGQIISKIYDQPGTYLVSLTVTDAAGVKSTLTRLIEVLPADQIGLFNAYVFYKVRWDRDKNSKDTLQLTAQLNVGEQVVGAGTTVALDIVGQHFEGTLDRKLRDRSDPNDSWQVKANLRNQPFGTVLLKVKIKNANLGLGFNQAGALPGGDPHDFVDATIPVRITIGGHSFEINVASEFKFNANGKRAKGEGDE